MSTAAQPWCPWCAYARTCHACTADRVVAVIRCTCTPLTRQTHHEHECPAAAAQRDGLDVLPPVLHREHERVEWGQRGGEWVRTGVTRWRTPVVEAAPPLATEAPQRAQVQRPQRPQADLFRRTS